MKRLLTLWLACCLVGAACSGSDDGDEVLGTTDEPTPTPLATTAPVNDEPSTTGVTVGDLLAGEPRDAVVSGAVLWDASSARLCDVLMESFPPQCGDPSVVITNPEQLTVELEESGDVRWTDRWVDLAGFFDSEQFVLTSEEPASDVEADDQALAAAFITFAHAPTAETMAALPLAEAVALGLGPEIVMTVDRAALSDSSSWLIDRDEFRGWSGPFSALDLTSEPYQVTIGAHDRCVSPPEPAPTGFEDLRRVSLQPTDATSCLEWWTIDLFVADTGDVKAITLDLFAP